MVKPPTLMVGGAAAAGARRQFNEDGVPAPGQPWHEAQSVGVTSVKAAWNEPSGLTLRWQLLQRPVEPFITNTAPPVKRAWKLACSQVVPAPV